MERIPWLALVTGLLCAAAFPGEVTRGILAAATSTLFEAVPFLIAARTLRLPAFATCGCGTGPAARSVPALFATWLVFGPPVALLRWISAEITSRLLPSTKGHEHGKPTNILSDLVALAPYSLMAGIISHLIPAVMSKPHLSPVLATALGGALGFFLAPCGFGVVGIASALRGYAPFTAIGFLCIAGICDLRTVVRMRPIHIQENTAALAALAIACAFVAWQRGASLVHPGFTLPLWISAIVCAYSALRLKKPFTTIPAIVPVGMLVTAILGAPAPVYTASATTLEGAFPGERLTFTGVLFQSPASSTLSRYAITCCRADASPVSVKLLRPISLPNGRWVRAEGVLERHDDELRLRVKHFALQAPPADPFIYR